LRRADFLPGRRALIVSASVALTAFVVYAVVPAIAPRFAAKAPLRFATALPTDGEVVVGSAAAGPVHTTAAPSTDSPLLTFAPRAGPTGSPTSRPRSEPDEQRVRLHVSMTVDRTTASTGEIVQYDVLVRNTGDRSFRGALTTNIHTPAGTLRCDMQAVLEICSTQGDYDGSSRDPNAAHANPAGVSRIMTIEPDEAVTLYTLRVQIAPSTGGTVLHNHAHVDGFGSITALANDVTTKTSVRLLGNIAAPDVLVTG
jgi:uncharacterized repeat protein (TIGR01451 family)